MKAVGGRHLCLLLLAATLAACSCSRSPSNSSASAKASSDDVRVQVSRVGFDDQTGANYVLLIDEKESRALPIMIGESEAQAIMLALHGIKPERPFTHDLIRSIIGQTGNSVDRIVIGDLRDEIYYATIYLDGGRYSIDSRPSDAIALAMGMNAPIYVNNRLLESSPTVGLGGGGKIPDTARALGLTVEELTPELASAFGKSNARGLLVSEVDSSAKKAGVARGDIVVKVGDRDVNAVDDFSRRVASVKNGAVTLTLNRDGASRTVTLAADTPKP
jgi:bifunctional DNase/RNase